MSARNGDKSRFGRQRKQKIRRRVELRALRPAPAQGTELPSSDTPAMAAPVTEAPAQHEGEGAPPEAARAMEGEGLLTGAARKLGSALGTIAVETHLATPPSEHQE